MMNSDHYHTGLTVGSTFLGQPQAVRTEGLDSLAKRCRENSRIFVLGSGERLSLERDCLPNQNSFRLPEPKSLPKFGCCMGNPGEVSCETWWNHCSFPVGSFDFDPRGSLLGYLEEWRKLYALIEEGKASGPFHSHHSIHVSYIKVR